jgi:hypothetical protein
MCRQNPGMALADYMRNNRKKDKVPNGQKRP